MSQMPLCYQLSVKARKLAQNNLSENPICRFFAFIFDKKNSPNRIRAAYRGRLNQKLQLLSKGGFPSDIVSTA